MNTSQPSLEFDFESLPGIALGVGRGVLTLADAEKGATSMWRRAPGPPYRILWDLSEARFDLEKHDVQQLARFIKGAAPDTDLRTAFVVSRDREFGLVRMFEAYRDVAGARTATFRTREEAVEWLRQP